jgi:hypothetical protein
MTMKTLQRFLIVGLKELDAGKTTVAHALLLCLGERGIKACGFKPMAANTLWHNYDVVHEALSDGRLYGKDSKLLRNASYTDFPEELINPIHRLWATPPHYLNRTLPHFHTSSLIGLLYGAKDPKKKWWLTIHYRSGMEEKGWWLSFTNRKQKSYTLRL